MPGSTNLGVVDLAGGRALAIDSGLDESAARKLLRALQESGRRLTVILSTHSHADHIGGNAFLVQRTGCRVAAPAVEASLLRAPAWEPLYLFGGAYPPAPARSKFLMAAAGPVDLALEPGPVEFEGRSLELVPLPGHSPGQLGVLVGDVLFAADAYFDPPVLEKHGLPYFAAVQESLATLDRLESLTAGLVIPSHGRPVDDPRPSLDANRRAVRQGLDHALELLAGAGEGIPTETVVASLLHRLGTRCRDLGHYLLYRAAVLAYLTHLVDTGVAAVGVGDDNVPRWEVCGR